MEVAHIDSRMGKSTKKKNKYKKTKDPLGPRAPTSVPARPSVRLAKSSFLIIPPAVLSLYLSDTRAAQPFR